MPCHFRRHNCSRASAGRTRKGTVRDQTDAVVPGVTITIRHSATSVKRHLTSGTDGSSRRRRSRPASPPSPRSSRKPDASTRVTVATGRVLTVDLHMEIGQASEVVDVAAAAVHVDVETHAISGLITARRFRSYPSTDAASSSSPFSSLAYRRAPARRLSTTRSFRCRFGGDSNKTAITVDGGNVRNWIEGNTGMNFSQEVIQEFQLSSANFDLSTGITSVGAVNIVTRSGGNDQRRSGYFFYRDHDMAAYPGLQRDPLNRIRTSPVAIPGSGSAAQSKRIDSSISAITEHQPGRRRVISAEPGVRESLPGRSRSLPRTPVQHAVRLESEHDHTAFVRFSHDQNSGFGPSGNAVLPSNWLRT